MKGMYVKEDTIWPQFESAVDSLTIDEGLARQIADALNETKIKMQEAIKRDIASYSATCKELENREDEAFDLFSKGAVDETAYHRQISRLRQGAFTPHGSHGAGSTAN